MANQMSAIFRRGRQKECVRPLWRGIPAMTHKRLYYNRYRFKAPSCGVTLSASLGSFVLPLRRTMKTGNENDSCTKCPGPDLMMMMMMMMVYALLRAVALSDSLSVLQKKDWRQWCLATWPVIVWAGSMHSQRDAIQMRCRLIVPRHYWRNASERTSKQARERERERERAN